MRAFWRKIAMPVLTGIALAAVSSGMTRVSAQPADPVATPAKAASIMLAAPLQASSSMFLDIGVRAYTPPRRGAVEAIVTMSAGGGGGPEQEIGRFSVFPAERFSAEDVRQERTYRLDASAALSTLKAAAGPLAVKVRLAPAVPGMNSDDATLTVGRVVFQPRS